MRGYILAYPSLEREDLCQLRFVSRGERSSAIVHPGMSWREWTVSLMVIAMLQGSVKKAVNAAPDVHRATDCDRQVLTGQR